MPENEIYKFLKENDLTDKDEASFTKEYSDPKKAKELHNFMIENDLTDKDSATFYETYFDPSKKKVQEKPLPNTFRDAGISLAKPSTQESELNGEQPKVKTNPVEKINLYTQTAQTIRKKNSDLLLQAKKFEQAGDVENLKKTTALLEQNQAKIGVLDKGIEAQKQQAQIDQPNTVGNVFFLGAKAGLGMAANAANVLDDAVNTIKNDFWASLGIAPSKEFEESFAKFQEDSKDKFKRPSDIIAEAGKKLISEAADKNAIRTVGLPNQGDAWEALKEGNISKAAEYGFKGFVGSLPTSLLYTNPYTAAAASGGIVQGQLDEAVKEKGKATTNDLIAGGLKAGLEYFTEGMFGTTKVTKDVINKLGKEGAEKLYKEVAEGALKKTLISKLGRNTAEDIGGEVINQFGSNVVDKYVLDKKDVGLFDGIPNAAIISLFGGGTQGAAMTTLNHVIDKKQAAKYEENKAKADDLMQQALNAESPAVSTALELRAEKLNTEANKIAEEQNQIGEFANKDLVTEIKKRNAELVELEAAKQGLTDEEAISAIDAQIEATEKGLEVITKQAKEQALEEIKANEIVNKEAPNTADNGLSNDVVEPNTVKVEPIRQLGTGKNVYFETDKYRVNDIDGGVILNIQNQTDLVPVANIKFDNANDAVIIAKGINNKFPDGVPDALLVDKYVEQLKKELLSPTTEKAKGETAETPTTKETKTDESPVNEIKNGTNGLELFNEAKTFGINKSPDITDIVMNTDVLFTTNNKGEKLQEGEGSLQELRDIIKENPKNKVRLVEVRKDGDITAVTIRVGGQETIYKVDTKAVEELLTPKIEQPKTSTKEEKVENKKRVRKNKVISKILDEVTVDPIDKVLQYFIGGGKINGDRKNTENAIQKIFGKKGGAKDLDKTYKSYFNLTRNNAPTLSQLAHSLWEQNRDNSDYTSQDYEEAIIEVLSTHNGTNSMKEAFNNKFQIDISAEEIEREAADQAFREEQAQRLAEEQQQEFIEELEAQEAIDEPLVFELNAQEIEQVEELGITEETEELTAEQFEALEALLFGEPQPINNNENGNEKEVKQGEDNVTPKQSESKESSRQDAERKSALEAKVKEAKNAYDALARKLAKAKQAAEKAGQEQQANIFGGKPADALLFGTDLRSLNNKVKEIQAEADTAKQNLDKAQLALDSFVPSNQVQLEVETPIQEQVVDNDSAELADLKEQLKKAKTTSSKKVIQEKIDILLEKQPKSKQSRFVPQASEGVKQKQQSIIEKLKQAFPNIEIVEDETQLNEVLAKSGARQMNNNGVVYGAIYNGRIYLNPTAIRLDTPIHEFGHIWLDIAKNKYAEYYQNLINTIKATPYFEAAQLAYPDLIETQQAEEAVVQAIAEKGIEQLEAQDKKGVLRKIFDDIKAMGKAILNGLGIKKDMNFLKATWRDLVNKAAQDILSGKPITYATSEDIANMDIDAYPISIEGGLLDTSRKGVDRFISKLTGKKFEGLIPYLREMFKVGGNYPEVKKLDQKRIGAISEYMKQIEGTIFEFRGIMKAWSKGKTDVEINRAIQAMQVALTKSVDALAMRNIPQEFIPIIIRMRSNVDGFSQLLLDSGFIDPNTELAASISANLGVYMNRSYAAFVDDKWNEMMFPDSKKRTPMMEKIYKDAYNFIRNQYDNFVEVDGELYTLTTDGNGNITGIVDSMGNPVPDPFQMFPDPDLLTRIQKAYNNKEKLTVDEINNILKEFARFNKDNQFGKGGKIGKMDLSLFKKRQDIADPLRAFLGEYTEPQAMYINTMTKMAEYIENQKFLADLRKLGEGKIFFKDKPVGDYNVEITGQKEYSPLSGLYTSEQINNALKANNHELLNPDNTLVKIWYGINGFIKFGFTGLSVKSQVRNFGSNIFIGFVNGYYNPYTRVKNDIPNPFKLAWGELNKEGGDELAELAKYGVLESSAIGGELRDIVKLVFKDAYSQEFSSPENAFEWFTEKSAEVTSKFLNKAADVYKLGDNVHKIFAYYAELATVKYMFPNKTIEEQKTIAADRFNAVNINYGMVPEVIQYLRKNPIIAAFPTFAAEAVRITYNIPALAMSDIKQGIKSRNQQQISVGVNRLSFFTLGMTAVSLIPYFVGKSVGADDDDEELIRATAPEYAKNTPKVIVAKKDGTNYEVMDLSWQNPLNMPQVAYTSFKNSNESAIKSFTTATLEVLKPFISSEISTKIIVDVATNDNGSGFKIYNKEDNFWNQTKSISNYIYTQARPGIVKEITNIYKGATDREEFGRKFDLTSELKQTATGTKIYNIDAVKKLSSMSYKYQSIFEQDYKLYGSVKSEKSNTPDYAERVNQAFDKANKRYAERQQEVINYIQLLQKKGVPDNEIYEKIKSIGGPYNRRLAKSLIRGQIDQFEK